jgi:hypothetical protein
MLITIFISPYLFSATIITASLVSLLNSQLFFKLRTVAGYGGSMLGIVAHACKPSCSGGRDRRIMV